MNGGLMMDEKRGKRVVCVIGCPQKKYAALAVANLIVS